MVFKGKKNHGMPTYSSSWHEKINYATLFHHKIMLLQLYLFTVEDIQIRDHNFMTYFKHGTLSRSPSDELLLVEGWDWGGTGWELELPTGVDKGGGCSTSGESTSFISYNNRISSICCKRRPAYLLVLSTIHFITVDKHTQIAMERIFYRQKFIKISTRRI